MMPSAMLPRLSRVPGLPDSGTALCGTGARICLSGMTPETWDFNMARRIPIVIALVLVGTAVGLFSRLPDDHNQLYPHAQRDGAG